AHGNVLGAPLQRSRVANPLSLVRNEGLACRDIEKPILVLHSQAALEPDREIVKLRRLRRLFPTLRAAHMGHADVLRVTVHAAEILVDKLGLATRGRDAGGLWNQRRHELSDFQCNKSGSSQANPPRGAKR